MTPNEIVPMYLVIVMAVFAIIALVGGHMTDKKLAGKEEEKEE